MIDKNSLLYLPKKEVSYVILIFAKLVLRRNFETVLQKGKTYQRLRASSKIFQHPSSW